jgi:hypothetical protein
MASGGWTAGGRSRERRDLERFQAKQKPVRVKKTRQNKTAPTKVGEVSALWRGSAATHNQDNDQEGWWPPNPP